jgi:uncharacterized protein (TIGR02246 family)
LVTSLNGEEDGGVMGDVEQTVTDIYRAILSGWNAADADSFASVFAEDGQVVGFDGSEVIGRAQIAEQMAAIFADHATGSYVGIVREVKSLGNEVALLRAVCGVIPAGADDIEPALNAIQSIVARHDPDGWQVVLYQNTPAQYHGRPEAAAELSAELRDAMKADSGTVR